MTEKAQVTRPRRPSGAAVHIVAAALFLTVLVLLAFQMRAGRDPMVTASAEPAPKRVLVRRIERKVIITTIQPSAPAAAPSGGGAAPATAGGGAAPAPAPAAAAPAPAPAAPAPAPVVSRSS